jgi:hypothetical protein
VAETRLDPLDERIAALLQSQCAAPLFGILGPDDA